MPPLKIKKYRYGPRTIISLLILLVQPTTIPQPTNIYSPLRKKKMFSRPIFPCFSFWAHQSILFYVEGPSSSPKSQKWTPGQGTDFPPEISLPPSLRGLLPKKERKKEDSPFSPKGRKRKGNKGLSFSSFFFISLSLSILRRKRKGTCSSWLRVSAYHQNMNFQVIVNMGNYTFIYLFIFFCSNDFFSFSSIMSASFRIKFLS